MSPQKTVLTTGDVARICNVAPRTVSKWFDTGQLRGYRIPGSKDRRIPLDQLIRFMKAHGIPLNGLQGSTRRILVVDSDREYCDAIGSSLAGERGYEVTTANSAFEAGVLAQQSTPHVMLVDVSMPDMIPRALCRLVRSLPQLESVCLVGTRAGLTSAQTQALLQDGFDAALPKPFEVRRLIQLIEEACSAAAASAEVPAN